MNIRITQPLSLHELGRRDNQEDALWPPTGMATPDSRIFVVCDGMGGHENGEVASQCVTETIGNYLAAHLADGEPMPDSLLQDAIAAAYDRMDELDTSKSLRKMGTTLTLLCLHRGGATMAHIGDSRIYHLRPGRKPQPILYKSRDHSLVMDLFLAEELTYEETENYEGKNVITRAMLPHQERRSRPDIVHSTDIKAGDIFLLCSDGITGELTDKQLTKILTATANDESICNHLAEATAQADDNHTAYLIRITNVEHEPEDTNAPHNEDTSKANMMVIMPQHSSWLKKILCKWF